MHQLLSVLKKLVLIIPVLFKAIWTFLAAFLSIVAMYVLLTALEQGIDVVIHAGEYPERGILAMASIVVWAYMLWYSCRTLSYVNQDRDDRTYRERYRDFALPTMWFQQVPRFLAYHCFVCVQIAVFNLPTVYNLRTWQIALAFVLHSLLYAGLHLYFLSAQKRTRSVAGFVCLVLIICYSGFLLVDLIRCVNHIGAGIFGESVNRHACWLRFMCLILFALQILAVYYFIWRRKQIDKSLATMSDAPGYYNAGVADISLTVRQWLQHPRFSIAERKYFRIFNIVSAVGGVLYLGVVFSIDFANYMGPLALAILAVSILAGLTNLLRVISIRTRFSMFLVLLGIAMVVGIMFRDPYRVRLIKDGDRAHFLDRPTARSYMTRWFDKRLAMMETIDTYRLQKRTYDVYIVLSNGGASRAGKWTTNVLSYLQDLSRERDPEDTFGDHVLAIAGASGGTVGNCAFYSLLKAEHDGDSSFKDAKNYRSHTNRFFASDFLTFTLGRLLGPDIIRHIFPIDMDDRAAALARSLSQSRDPLLNTYFNKKLTDVFDYSGDLPMLFLTSTKVDDGMPGLISSVQLPFTSQRNDILKIIDNLPPPERGSNLSLATAAILSSRFPYVSPAGKVGNNYYVDGGYFDNSGAGTILELLGELSKLFEDNPQYANRFSFHILHNSNAEIFMKPPRTMRPLVNDLFAPLLTLEGMQGASTSVSTAILTQNFMLFSKDTVHAILDYNLYDKSYESDDRDNYEEGYPMSWVISDYQLARMDRALGIANAEMLRYFYFFDPAKDTLR